jgi:predicted component of type VI protein secretion system
MNLARARLEVVAGKAVGMSILVEDELLIGRHAEGAGRLADDDEISRSHARVTLDASGFYAIEDLGSTNGTFVNGLRISVPQTLAVGDTIELGGTTLAVRELPEGAPFDAAQTREQATPIPGIEPGRLAAADAPAAEPPHAPEAARPPAVIPARAALVDVPLAASSVASEDAPENAERNAKLGLRLEVNFVTREVLIALDGVLEPMRLVFEEGSWRLSRA